MNELNVLYYAVFSRDPLIRQQAAGHTSLESDLAEVLARDENDHVLATLASNPCCPAETLILIAHNTRCTDRVQEALRNNPNTPAHIRVAFSLKVF